MQMPSERSCHLTGTWFPGKELELQAMLDSWRSTEQVSDVGSIIVPHAGYVYSGHLAAKVYSSLASNAYDTVIILAPSHYVNLPHQISIEPLGSIITPLGAVHLDATVHGLLSSLPGATFVVRAHTQEHSIQIQLPMIQHFLGHCQVGAAVLGQWSDFRKLQELALGLRQIITPKTLVVVSTDFTHYGSNFGYLPFASTADVSEKIRALDFSLFEAIKAWDIARFSQILATTKATVCGQGVLKLLLAMLPEGARVCEAGYATSADLTGDKDNSVSYFGALVQVDWEKAPLPLQQAKKEQNMEAMHKAKLDPSNLAEESIIEKEKEGKLSLEAKQCLLNLAKQALQTAIFRGDKFCVSEILSAAVLETLPVEVLQLRGAFVTLHQHGALRGCIGEILPQRPLAQVVVERARDAALHDSRFYPVQASELPEISLDISVLGVPVSAMYEEIILGKHGIILQKDGKSAVFLPQVAPEQGWDLPTTLKHLAQKAGLPSNAWQNGASFFVFTAEVLE